jgi:hypothetical protein
MILNLIEYFYTAEYTGNMESSDTGGRPPMSDLQCHARMFALAEIYDVEGLRLLSLEKYQCRLEGHASAQEFLESLPDVYTLTPSSVKPLREIVTRYARINLAKYTQDQSAWEVFKEISVGVPEFVRDMLDIYIQSPLIGKCDKCGPYSPMQPLQGRCRQCKRGIHYPFEEYS